MPIFMLKDKQRHAAFEKALPGFSARFQKACSDQLRTSSAIYVTGDEHVWAVLILEREIEKAQEYDPKAWNSFPEVDPPDDVLMRVETSDGKKKCAYFHRFCDGWFWCDPDGSAWPQAFSDSVICYRPWED